MRLIHGLSDHDRPYVFPFIIIRPEGDIALLFNSISGRELELSPTESYITSLFDGSHTTAEAQAMLSERLSLEPDDSARLIKNTVDKLASAWAISTGDDSFINFCFTSTQPSFIKSRPQIGRAHV